jgi:cysteine desulfuration protein SufE
MEEGAPGRRMEPMGPMGPELPPVLAALVAFFEALPEVERRENLVAYAEKARSIAPRAGESFAGEDLRKDEQCTDYVGVFLRLNPGGGVTLRMTLGPEVQTLTRAMAVLLCRGLEGAQPGHIASLDPGFVSRLVGCDLVRIRARTVYYVLERIQECCRGLENREG